MSRSLMEDLSPTTRPFVLWFDTLPNGGTAKVVIYPRPYNPATILHRNNEVHAAYTFPTCETAIQWGWIPCKTPTCGSVSHVGWLL